MPMADKVALLSEGAFYEDLCSVTFQVNSPIPFQINSPT